MVMKSSSPIKDPEFSDDIFLLTILSTYPTTRVKSYRGLAPHKAGIDLKRSAAAARVIKSPSTIKNPEFSDNIPL